MNRRHSDRHDFGPLTGGLLATLCWIVLLLPFAVALGWFG